jgi:hypothetical protein
MKPVIRKKLSVIKMESKKKTSRYRKAVNRVRDSYSEGNLGQISKHTFSNKNEEKEKEMMSVEEEEEFQDNTIVSRLVSNQFNELKELKNQFNEFKNEMRKILLLSSIQSQVIINKTNTASIETSMSKEVKIFNEQIESKTTQRKVDDLSKASRGEMIMEEKIKQNLPNTSNQYKDQISSQLNVIQDLICDSNRFRSRKTANKNVCFHCAKPNHSYNDCRSASMDEKNAITNSLKEKKFDFNSLRERAASFSNKRRNQHLFENQNNNYSQNTVDPKKAKN